MFEIKPWENQNVQKPKFSKNRKSLTTIKFWASQVAIYTVFHAESESAVRNLRKLQENQHFEKTKISKIFPRTPYFLIFLLRVKELLNSDRRFGFCMKNCIYGQLEMSRILNLGNKNKKCPDSSTDKCNFLSYVSNVKIT